MLCAKQQIALRGHRDDRIDFSEPATSNEGNFLALIRLLAKHDDHLKEHLVNSPKNARYVSKTVQDEIIHIAANLIRDYFRQCLELCPHFTVIADETNSQGRQILSVCIRLLDFLVDDLTPKKREVLIDICDLDRKTGKLIAEAIAKSFSNHKIDISNCKAQAYDNRSSMTSEETGVNAEIRKLAPDAECQECVLYSLNFVITEACKISTIVNMMGSCRELCSFFDNSPKRQKFLEVVYSNYHLNQRRSS